MTLVYLLISRSLYSNGCTGYNTYIRRPSEGSGCSLLREEWGKPRKHLDFISTEIRCKRPPDITLERYQVQILNGLYNRRLSELLLTHCLYEINVNSILLLEEAIKYGGNDCCASVLESKQTEWAALHTAISFSFIHSLKWTWNLSTSDSNIVLYTDHYWTGREHRLLLLSFSWFSSVPPEKCRKSTLIRPRPLPPTFFTINHSIILL
jgi:hypothetical protein